ncbi:MAG TPA: MFS transporter [Dongiaceae bacterium]
MATIRFLLRPGILSSSWFFLLLAHTFILQGVIIMVRVATSYRAATFGLDEFWIGVIGGAFGFVPALFGLHLGNVMDRYGETKSLIAGSALIVLACLLFWLTADTLPVLLIASILLGLGQFICVAGQQSSVARAAPDGQRESYFGRLTVSVSLAQAVGPMVIGLFGRHQLVPDIDGIFLASSGTGVALLALSCLLRIPFNAAEGNRLGVWQTARFLLRDPAFLLSAIAGLVVFSAMDLLVIYLPLYGIERSIAAGTVGTLLALRATASILSRLMFSRLFSWFGRGRLLIFSMLLAGIAIVLLTVNENPIFMSAAMLATGFGLGIGGPLTLAWITEICPSNMRAAGVSLRLALNRVGQALLPIGVGGLVAGIGASGVLAVTGFSLLAMAAATTRYFSLPRR